MELVVIQFIIICYFLRILNHLQEEYLHLKRDVQIWDVSVQRELEVYGKDAYEFNSTYDL